MEKMTSSQYVDLAAATAAPHGPTLIGGVENAVLHAVLGVQSEGGEAADILKRMLYYGKPYDAETRLHLDEEFGDILWYIALYCRTRGVSMEALMRANIAKLKHRYPHKFDPNAAIRVRDVAGEREAMKKELES
jgi:NTP pyrophosphatase (non-canonical NTP hydrolase)